MGADGSAWVVVSLGSVASTLLGSLPSGLGGRSRFVCFFTTVTAGHHGLERALGMAIVDGGLEFDFELPKSALVVGDRRLVCAVVRWVKRKITLDVELNTGQRISLLQYSAQSSAS
ncbi:uncharacterized protein RAG0_03632 [Rhynchosporium agropyri]|uniref:Uncharacterized protein n=1 Tax=Rhynchosporium agropyri TaxID=914238 RepID=A0A1E1K577_9HELO|nr:uncharacterized protein RAG0_03632 [Rhynchosporium agropyri]